jgi:hypothetical protein
VHSLIYGIIKFFCISFVVLLLASCGGGSNSDGFEGPGDSDPGETPTDPTDPTVPTVSDIQLLTSSPQLQSAGNDTVTLTAVVRDENNVVVPDVSVGFSTDDGNIRVTQAVTDETGTAEAIFEVGANQANRTATVTANASGLEDSVTIEVVGTSVAVSGPSSAVLNDRITYTFTLQDSAGEGIAGETLEVTSALGANINPSTPVTDESGQATATVIPTTPGTDTITVTGANATASQQLEVSPDNFVFVQPAPPPAEIREIPLNTSFPITVRWTSSGVPVVGQPVNFSATRGVLSPSLALTNAQGQATVNIQANSAGPSIITAADVGGGPSAQIEILFVATVASELNLQASPATLGTNPPGSDGEQSTITAIVRDPNDNPVKGKIVNFSLEDVTGGSIFPSSAVTDEFGRASTVYTSGSVPSAENAVTVNALVADTPAVRDTVNLTVARRELFITLGTGNQISEPDATRYQLPYSVLVTDAVGGPVAGARVTLDIIPDAYYKGNYPRFDNVWIQEITAGPCPNEDIDGDGILDPGEDLNGNNRLDPGNLATLSPPSAITGEDGFALFDVLYAQEFGNWVDVRLVAEARVTGTEAEEITRFTLPVLSDDLNQEDVRPPGSPSPFGQGTSCANEL